MDNIVLRPEQPDDHRQTETMIREAFWNHFSPGCDEHYLIHIMRSCPAFVPWLNYVAVQNGKIVGNIAYMKGILAGGDGKDYEVLSLGPISVSPLHQRRGIGGKLIEHTRQLARKMEHRAVLLYGDPAYYTRQGFTPAEQWGIRTADNMYAVSLHVCPLYEDALAGLKGRYVEDAIYEIDQAAVAEFDKNFPPKEKISGTPSQKRFSKLVAMRRSAD